jgi:hypothetical protein
MKFQISLEGVDRELNKLFNLHKQDNKLKSEITVATMVADLVSATPIDTGHARSSWSVDNIGDVFNVRNDAEYIQYLNEGTSKQAPSRFIEAIALKYGNPLGTIVEVKD